ncbi:D-alanyl-D-alanine carboxypeptidase family protein [Pectinatus haikarae]|uniref:serine-type D-Ala-D-Ala carboxypeptidase n=1 Tax=Pectinatus haikarae TaxID=349096 RepID=A0ABT9Y611_9FIRM|nr:D-alanyl-D-alanine carboxypeptidase family protein [Pectinatus haikarae]MDQ0203268.1 D-alanyl-D-alanine carboxypeptidase (penicillin-binding protein 5/6) [Pectinatus haikarae]
MRFLRYLIFAVIFSLSSLTSASAQDISLQQFSSGAPPEYGLTAKSAILIEASTGRVIFEKNADVHEYPASMTKMMTAVLSLEMTNPNDIVHISDEATNVDGSSLYLEKGDIMHMDELRQGMMLVSGNDAAVAIADAIGGTTSAFVDLMNKKAQSLGAVNTHFVNPNGLPDPNHYSTARDMAKIAAYAYENEDFRKIVSAKEKEIHWLTPDKKMVFENTNHLLWNYPYANGIKTGYTDDAGGCLAASATRNGVTLIAVVMHTEDGQNRFSEAQELLDYGFKNVRMQPGYKKTDLMQSIHVHNGKTAKINVVPQSDISYPLIDGESGTSYSIKVNLPQYLEAPVKTGDKVGSVDIFYNNNKVGEVPMTADRSSGTGFNLESLCYALYDSITSLFATA